MSDPNTDFSTLEQPIPAPTPTLAERDKIVIRRLKAVAGSLLLALAAISFLAGTPGLLAAGEWAQLEGWMRWLTPAVVDGGLVFSAASAMAHRAEIGKAGLLPWASVLVLSAVSVAAQATHVLVANDGQIVPESVVGATIASLFPLVVLASTRSFETLRFGRLIEREATRAARSTGGRSHAARSAVTRPAGAQVATRPATPARPRAASHKAGRPVIDMAVREAAVARVQAGDSQRQVARELGISRGAVQSWLKPT